MGEQILSPDDLGLILEFVPAYVAEDTDLLHPDDAFELAWQRDRQAADELTLDFYSSIQA